MNVQQFEAALKAIGMSQTGAAHFFGITSRTLRRWIAEDHIARPVAMVLSLMVAKKLSAKQVLEITGVRDDQVAFILDNLARPVGVPGHRKGSSAGT